MHRYTSERLVWEPAQTRYIFADRPPIYPAFGRRPDLDESHYEENEPTCDSARDAEASSADEDSVGDGCA